jgi:ribosomal protein S18 acetylase RimI-like enzyme
MGLKAIPEGLKYRQSFSLIIRPAHTNDAEGIFKVLRDSRIDTYPNKQYGISKNDFVVKFSNKHKWIKEIESDVQSFDSEHKAWVAGSGNKIIGFIEAGKYNEKVWIKSFYILTQYQGKGIGSLMLNKAIKWSKNLKQTTIWLEVVKYNKRVVDFYKRRGFTEVPNSETFHTVIPGKFIPTIGMKMNLDVNDLEFKELTKGNSVD